jgi:hypothetical protein
MKFLVLSFFLGSFAMAETPEHFCDINPYCTEAMHDVVETYRAGDTGFVTREASGYSGECYHINEQYDPTTTHHGAFTFEKSPKGFISYGVFSFFASENPYKGLSFVELKERLSQLSNPSLALVNSEAVTMEFQNGDSKISYWFRSGSDAKVLTVIGLEAQQSTRNFVFCKMQLY